MEQARVLQVVHVSSLKVSPLASERFVTKRQFWSIAIGATIVTVMLVIAGLVWWSLKIPDAYRARIEDQIGAMRADLPVGLSREEVYTRLKARNLVAYDPEYPILKRDPNNNEALLITRRDWPPMTITVTDVNGKVRRRVTHPPAYVHYWMGTSLRCSASVELVITFDGRDRISRTSVTPLDWVCM
jgi:hypothetical protein